MANLVEFTTAAGTVNVDVDWVASVEDTGAAIILHLVSGHSHEITNALADALGMIEEGRLSGTSRPLQVHVFGSGGR